MIQEFIKPAIPVNALQFQDNQDSVEEVFRWLHGAFYVFAGEDHEMRLFQELDGEGHVLTTAPSFLIIKTPEGEERVNPGDWIVKSGAGVSVYDELTFGFTFEKRGIN